MLSDLRLRSRQFSSVPGSSHGDMPRMCPGRYSTGLTQQSSP